MKIIDLTQTISNTMPVYPGTAAARLELVNTYETDGFRETLLAMTSHTGTHMDAPFHLFGEGARLEDFPAAQFVGKALVIDCRDLGAGESIGMERIEAVRDLADEAEMLLFCTGWDRYWGQEEYFGDYPVISTEICDYALQSGKKALGFDTIGIDPIADHALTRHKRLLSQAEIVIIENLTNLDEIGGGLFTLAALPLKYEAADGAPTRAVAILGD